MASSKAFNLLRPELILRIAQYADWRTVIRLQSVCCRCRSALADDGNHHQRIVWRQCVCERWPWVQYEDIDASWLATFRTWRRVYAYLRSVRFVPSAARLTREYTTWSGPGPGENAPYRYMRDPAVSRTPALRASSYARDIPGAPMALVEECALADEPLAEPRRGDLSECPVTLASLRPGIVAGPAVWEAMFTVYTSSNGEFGGGFLVGVETLAGDRWFFDVGNLAIESAYGSDPRLWARRVCFSSDDVYEWNVSLGGPLYAPNRLHLSLNLGDGELVLSYKSQFEAQLKTLGTLQDRELAATAAAGPLRLFVGLAGGPREENWRWDWRETAFSEEPKPHSRAWNEWTGERERTGADLAYATLDRLSLRERPGNTFRRTPGRPPISYSASRRIPSHFPLFPQFLPKLKK